MVILEVCAGSLESATTAEKAGASRVELCGQLEVGGLTPSWGVIKAAAKLSIPVHVLIRPRTGGFDYSASEIQIMEADIEAVGQSGCAGVVIGVLKYGDVDVPVLERLVQLARQWKLSVTFHRAFDDLHDMEAGLEAVIAAGCDRLLTSGGAISTEEPAARRKIRSLIEQARDQIVIMPGAGITPQNVASLVRETGAREVHASCKKVVTSEASMFQTARWETDGAVVEELLSTL
jgi:copper homeostasis protein